MYGDRTVSVIISTYNRPEELKRAVKSVLDQTYTDFEIIIIGDNCPHLNDNFMINFLNELYRENPYIVNRFNNLYERFRWWNLDKNYKDGGVTPRNYALRRLTRTPWITYLDDDNVWLSEHLECLMNALNEKPSATYAISSFIMDNGKDKVTIMCNEPKKYRIDTSSFIHHQSLIKKYGYWKDVPCARDWLLVSRWNLEVWAKTDRVTMLYSADTSRVNIFGILNAYEDQYDDQEQSFKLPNPKTPLSTDCDVVKKTVCLSTLHCNDRKTIFRLIRSVVENTQSIQLNWTILAQGCSEKHIEELQTFIQTQESSSTIKFRIHSVKENLGCGKGHDLLAKLTKEYYYIVLLEDDWFFNKSKQNLSTETNWLIDCVSFMNSHPHVSTIYLRKYNNDEEKNKSGWGRSFNYTCHRYNGENFNYRKKLGEIEMFNGKEFRQIKNFLFTFNPHIRHNRDYYRAGVFPLDTRRDEVSAGQQEWSTNVHKVNPTWGWSEAMAMEKTRDLITYNYERGCFSHCEELGSS
jgi:GT2 family glycosyltransferase